MSPSEFQRLEENIRADLDNLSSCTQCLADKFWDNRENCRLQVHHQQSKDDE
jgi:hypothetical protein